MENNLRWKKKNHVFSPPFFSCLKKKKNIPKFLIVQEIAATLSRRKVTEIILGGAFTAALPECLSAIGGARTAN